MRQYRLMLLASAAAIQLMLAAARPVGIQTVSSRKLRCVDTYPACPGWAGQCSSPGVPTYCPCMCGVATNGSPTPSPTSSPPLSATCTDTYATCVVWGPGNCTTPGVATYCPCMCGVTPSPSPSPAPSQLSPSPSPTSHPSPPPTFMLFSGSPPPPSPIVTPSPSPSVYPPTQVLSRPPSATCTDTYASCVVWGPGNCTTPGVATYCPCMCGVTPSPRPSPAPSQLSPSPSPTSYPSPPPTFMLISGSPPPPPSPIVTPSPSPSVYPPTQVLSPPPSPISTPSPSPSVYPPLQVLSPPPSPIVTPSPPPSPTIVGPVASPPPPPPPSPVVSFSPAVSPSPAPPPMYILPTGIPLLSPYKDVGINMNWNTYAISSMVTGTFLPVTQVMPASLSVLTWAFATGECGSESWAGVTPSALTTANIQAFVTANKKYIISTGGAAGTFTCGTDAGFAKFIQTYYSSHMLGIDFDIEGGQTQSQINNLVQRVKTARITYPNLRFSFTLATLGAATGGNQLNQLGIWVMQALQSANMGWNNIFVNLMAMDYGSASASVCTLNVAGKCDMGKSAINAAESLYSYWGVPYSSIEITPMVGGNDVTDEVFTVADARALSAYTLQTGFGGIHFWSLDRDRDCAPGWASPTCNTYGSAGTLGFTNTILTSLGM